MRIWPEYIDLKYFADQLVFEYSNAQLPILYDENKWQEWATYVASNPAFIKFNIPAPATIRDGTKKQTFKTWQEWAKAAYICVNTANSVENPN